METPISNSLLAIILQAKREDLFRITMENDSRIKAKAPSMSPEAISDSIQHKVPASFDNIKLRPKYEREGKLADFLLNLTPACIEWIEEVKNTYWDAVGWKSSATQLFMTAESRGVSGTASFAILAASMALQGFPVPKGLSAFLGAAKRNCQQQVKELADAEKRRESELKNKHQN